MGTSLLGLAKSIYDENDYYHFLFFHFIFKREVLLLIYF